MFEGKKVLIVTPHLSTGGSPQYLLEFLRENKDQFSDFLLVEHSNFSDEFVVQKNKIINLIGKCNHVTLGRYGESEPLYTLNRSKLIDIIDEFKPEVIWMNECPESYEYQLPPQNVLDYIYQESREYKIVETTHYNAFDFSQKRYIPDEFMFCSEKHMMTSSSIDIPKTVWEVPIHIKERPNREKTLKGMGLDPNKLHVLNVGLFNGNKNQKYIFDLAKDFLDKDVMFHFVGNSCFFEECGIGEDINLPNCKVWGERDDVDTFMSCMDIYLFPSKKELNPLTVKEALSWDMEVVVNRDENYIFQYVDLDNFHILDEIDIHQFIDDKIKFGKFLLVASFYNNTKEHVENTFVNVLKQTYKNWVLIVGDDFSDDPDFRQYLKNRVVELNDKRIIYYDVKEKRELYLYQNFFQEFDYDYYFDLDADDIIDENILQVYDYHFRKYPNVQSIFSNLSQVNEEGRLLKYYLTQPVDDYVEEFDMRTQTKTDDLWENRVSYSMFGHGRCMRRPEGGGMTIMGNQKTSTDSFFLFYNLNRGDHLNIPRNLYTYVRRENSDSGFLTDEESRKFNENANYYLNLYKNKTKRGGWVDVYDDIWKETAALSVCDFLNDVDDIVLFTDNICQKEIDELYPDKNITFNDYEGKNAVVVWENIGGERKEKLMEVIDNFDNVTIYYINQNFNIDGDLHSALSTEKQKVLNVVSKHLTNFIWFDFFRHLVITKKTKIDNNLIDITYNNGAKVEVRGDYDKTYDVRFIDDETNQLIYQSTIQNNMWVSPSPKYYVKWRVEVSDETGIIKSDVLNLEGKKVLIDFHSSSLGDSLAWIPYVEEFRKKHNCEVYCQTHKTFLYEKSYPEIKFDIKDMGVPYASYKIGWFYDDKLNKNDVRTIPLQQTATDILGLGYKEIVADIDYSSDEKKIIGKYVTLSTQSTAQCKYWNKKGGWDNIVKYLKKQGYRVICVDQYKTFGTEKLMNTIPSKSEDYTGKPLDEVMNLIYHAEFHIGISSGLSWLSWAMKKPTVMVSSFSKPFCEFTTNCYRVYKDSVKSGYFNNDRYRFKQDEWSWNPIVKCESLDDWDRFEPITTDDVLEKVKELLDN